MHWHYEAADFSKILMVQTALLLGDSLLVLAKNNGSL